MGKYPLIVKSKGYISIGQLSRIIKVDNFELSSADKQYDKKFDAYIHQAFNNISVFAPYLLVATQLTGILEDNRYYPELADTPVMETNYEEDDEAARFIAQHADLFKEELMESSMDESIDDYNFFGDDL